MDDEPQRVPFAASPDPEIAGEVDVDPESDAPPEDRLLPWAKVEALAGISRTTAWREQKRGAFPAPVVLSRRRVAWRESEVVAWKAARPQSSTLLGPARFIPVEPPPEPAPCGAPPPASFAADAAERPGIE